MPDDGLGRRAGPLDRRILALSGALRTHLLVSVAVAAAVTAAILTQAEAVSRLLPRLIDGDRSAVAPLVGCLLAVGAVRALAAAVTERSGSRALIAARSAVRTRVLDHLGRLRPDARTDLGPARVSALTTTAVDALEPWVRAYLPGLVLAVMVPLAVGLRILQADLVSAAILVVVVPLIPIFMILIGKATEAHAAAQWEALQRLAGRFLDALTGLPTLRLFGRADAQVDRVRAVTERYRQATMRTLRIAFLSALVLEVLATMSVALVAVSLGVRLTGGGVDLRTALLVLLLAPECLLPIRRVSAAFHAAAAGTDAAVDIEDALGLPAAAEGSADLPAIGRLIATSAAVTDPIRGCRLPPTSISVAPGELVALTGASGTGKSTLLDVLRGSLAPDSGTVVVGSVAVSDLPRTTRARAIPWVPQNPDPLGATVAASAAIGHPTGPVTEAAVALALEQVGLAAQARLRPDQVSGGQLRRLALARALVGVHLGSTRFLLLDEPTAQLDDASAAAVVRAIRWAADSGVGVLAATHDLSVAAVADATTTIEPVGTQPDRPGQRSAVVTERSGGLRPAVPSSTMPTALDPSAASPGRSGLRWLLRAARPHRRRLIGAQLLGIAAEACTVGLAGTAAWLIVRAAERPSFAALAVAAVAVRAFGLGKGVLRYGERLASHDATIRLLADLRATVVGRLAHLSPTGLGDAGRGDLLSRLVDDIDRLQDLFLRVLGPVVSVVAVAAVAVAITTILSPPAGMALALAVLVVAVALPATAYRTSRVRSTESAVARGDLTGRTVDLAEHIEELAACGGEAEWRARIDDAATRLDRVERSQAWTTAAVSAVAAAAPALGMAAVIAAVGPAGPQLPGPALGVVALLPLAVLELAGQLTIAGDVLARVEAAAARVAALIGRPDPVTEPVEPAELPADRTLDLDDVSIAWPDAPPQVTGVDLTLPAGARAVISGPSGSGKSTIAAALVRFLAPVHGTYRIGDADTNDLGGDHVRRSVTWCQQDPWFADSTLADNLRIARPAATDADLWAALAVVHLDAWTHRLPDGLQTRLQRDAGAMSGGERQRLALARALLGGQRAIVLDEPTAHLDGPTGVAVLADLLAATLDQGVIVITHGDTTQGIGPEYRIDNTGKGTARWRAVGSSVHDSAPNGSPT